MSDAGGPPSSDGLSDDEIDRIVERELGRTPEGGRELCPECGSSDTAYELGGETGKKYRCNDCGYVGALIFQVTDDELAAEARDADGGPEAED